MSTEIRKVRAMRELDKVNVTLPMHGKCANRGELRIVSGLEFGVKDMTVTGAYHQCSTCWRTMWVDPSNIARVS